MRTSLTLNALVVLALLTPSALAQKASPPATAAPTTAKPAAPAAAAKPAAPTTAKPAAPAAAKPAAPTTAKPAVPTTAKPAAAPVPKPGAPAKVATPAATPPAEYQPIATANATPGASLAKASDPQKAEAAAAMKAGRAAFDASNYEEALGKFRHSYGVVASPNSRMMLARTLAKLGRLVDAYHEAKVVAGEANAAAASNPKYKPTADSVREDIADLEKKLAFVTVNVMGEPEGATLTVGKTTLDRKLWGTPIPLAPGRVEVALVTPDGKSREVLELLAGAKITLPLDPPVPGDGGEKVSKVASSWTGPDRKMIGYVASGVGGVGMLLFGTFGALSGGQYSRLDSGCPSRLNCDPSLADVADRGKAYQAAANTTLVIGLLGVATGATFIVWDANDGGGWPWENAGIERPRLAVGPGEITVSGSF